MPEEQAVQKRDQQEGGERKVEAFDFLRPRRVLPGALRTLRLLHEGCAEALATMLSSRLQSVVTAGSVTVEQRFYHECLASVQTPACVQVFRTSAPAASGALILSPRLALAFVARMLGGATLAAADNRALTRIEQRVLGVLTERMLGELSTVWKGIGGFTAAPERFESEPDFIRIAARGDIMLSIALEIGAAGQQHQMLLWLPVTPLEEVLGRLAPPPDAVGAGAEASPWADAVRRRLEGIPVPVRCVLGDSLITLRELRNLAPGDVLRTGVSIEDELHIRIGDRARFRGRPGIANSRVALRITDIEPVAEQGA